MGLPENGVSPATERLDAGAQLDAIIASGRVPDPADSRELPAHLERARRRALERDTLPSASTSTNVPPPHSLTKRHRPDDSLAVVVVLVAVALLAGVSGFLLGQTAVSWGVIL